MSELLFESSGSVEAVLSSTDFAPPPAPETITGALAELRASMARFSGPGEHAPRRAEVESVIAALDEFPFEQEAERQTRSRLRGARIDAVADLGFVVPTATLATALLSSGPEPEEAILDGIGSDVLAVVEVVGRQLPATDASNDAAQRLRDLFADHAAGPTAAISLLYQNHDATPALLAATLIARHRGERRRSSLARTVRVATNPTNIDGVDIPAGTIVALDLEASGFEFGAGPHKCPGQNIAERLVAGISAAIEASAYRVIEEKVVFPPDGRVQALPIEP